MINPISRFLEELQAETSINELVYINILDDFLIIIIIFLRGRTTKCSEK